MGKITVTGRRESNQIKFCDMCQDAYFHQHIQEFTCEQRRDKPALLDLRLTKNILEIENLQCKAPVGGSDHVIPFFHFCLEGATLKR